MTDQRDFVGPVNIGNPQEITVAELARRILDTSGSTSEVVYSPAPEQDPVRRQPDITLASGRLGWSPEVSLEDGLERTVNWFRSQTSK